MAITKKNITAVILAGGKGRRLEGQDKGFVEINNKPLIEYVIERIQPQVKSVMINANRNQQRYKNYGHPVISDDLSDFQGPLAGIATAMNTAKTSHILTLPCDAPLIPDDLVSKMLSMLSKHAAPDSIVVAHDGTRLQSIHALIPVFLLQNLQDFLNNGQRKVEDWYQQHSLISADFSDNAQAFRNINTQKQRQEVEFTLQ